MPTVLALMAHPDDAELTCAGTLLLLGRAGWTVHVATMTPGDLGSSRLPPAQIAAVRRKEAAASATIAGARYTCLEFGDLTIIYSAEAKRRVSGFLRHVRPDLVITHSPVDYMADHEETARIVREAAFAASVPYWQAPWQDETPPPCSALPTLLHADPVDLTDSLGAPITPHFLVDVTEVFETKRRMLACHESQRSWLKEQHGNDDYLAWMDRVASVRGREFGRGSVAYAEGFRQCRASGFPKPDLLGSVLGREQVKALG